MNQLENNLDLNFSSNIEKDYIFLGLDSQKLVFLTAE